MLIPFSGTFIGHLDKMQMEIAIMSKVNLSESYTKFKT